MTREERQKLRDAALRAVVGTGTPSWELQTSNSFRRIGCLRDGDVLSADVQRLDGQPDLRAAPGVLDYVVAAQPRVVLELLGALDEAEGALHQARAAAEKLRVVLGEVPL